VIKLSSAGGIEGPCFALSRETPPRVHAEHALVLLQIIKK
jgi:hypothetical protein